MHFKIQRSWHNVELMGYKKMSNPFNATRQTIINILVLPLALAVAAGASWLVLSAGESTPHEASFGDVGGGLLFVFAIFAAIIFWVGWMIFRLIKHGSHRGFLFANIAVLLSPVLVVVEIQLMHGWGDNEVTKSIKTVTLPLACEQKQLFFGGEQIVGMHRSADTVFLVTGRVQTIAADTQQTFKYNDSLWRGFVIIKQNGIGSVNVDYSYSAVLGSLKYYAFYKDSLYAGIDKQSIIDYEYKLETRHHDIINAPSGRPNYYDELVWQVEVKAEHEDCKYPMMDYRRRDYPIMYIKDTVCKPAAAAAYPKLYGFDDAGLWKQAWQRYTVDNEDGLFIRVRQSAEVDGDEHRGDSIQVAHFTKKQVRVYNLHAPVSTLRGSEMGQPFCSLFRQGDKLYVLWGQGIVYFKIPGS